jgi:hypothetical protein
MVTLTHVLIIAALALGLMTLVRAKLIQVDLFFPWFFAVVVLGIASTSPDFVNWLGPRLGILYPPLAVVFLVIFLLVGILITLTISVTKLRARQAAMVQHLAALTLELQEDSRTAGKETDSDDGRPPPKDIPS